MQLLLPRHLFQLRQILSLLPLLLLLNSPARAALPEGFLYLDRLIPDAVIELRYSGTHNFVGEPITGYEQARPVLSQAAALALARVQEELRPFGLGIKIFDAYRPQRAVDHFVRWATDLQDTRMKAEFYPDVDKQHLFRDDYIAARSGHSRGSTVDLTLVNLAAPHEPLDMGTPFDYFGPASWPEHAALTPQQRANRLLLQRLMQKHGFRPYPREWWHFTLEAEPHPEQYFDFLPR